MNIQSVQLMRQRNILRCDRMENKTYQCVDEIIEKYRAAGYFKQAATLGRRPAPFLIKMAYCILMVPAVQMKNHCLIWHR